MAASERDVQTVLNYEWEQMRSAEQLYVGAQSTLPFTGEQSAYFDSFALHTRNLRCFFWNDRYDQNGKTIARSDDLLAVDYVPASAGYRFDPSGVLSTHIVKANKTVAHLTEERILRSQTDRQWDAPAVVAAMDTVLRKFAAASAGRFSFASASTPPPSRQSRPRGAGIANPSTVMGSTETGP